ncbi:WecB/TagA/CpsF family glycosyltransferase [Rhodococcoides kroppenstedtii]|uniref:WecB/TagA/CpsF family glycosyltransferase n=1 Tax=Rhodococcoides kroppenstedtii TaxID=293050 RepID=UPI0027E02F80|nr:WecB/TagA/CpsF family glycosyltransferase [Rhodococcus kroppenstedtii]
MDFEISNLDTASTTVLSLAVERVGVPVRLSNAYCVALADKDLAYRSILNGPGYTYPDGTPVAWFMNAKIKTRQAETVRGPSLFERCLDRGRSTGTRHFFLGTTPGTLELLVSGCHRRFPGIEIAGTLAPPFAPIEDGMIQDIAEAIAEADADVVWVALGTPKQDFLAARLAPRVERPCIGVGAAFDFLAGTTDEAPKWVQNSGMEWLYRFFKEPRRLWRRYLIGNVVFLKAATRELWRNR